MIFIDIPFLEDYSGAIQLQNFHLYSSIFETVPSFTFTIYSNTGLTPELLNLHIGTSLLVRYRYDDTSEDEGKNMTDYKYFNGFIINNINTIFSETGTEITIKCIGEFLTHQKTNKRNIYKNKYAKEIITNILDDNEILKYQGDKAYNRNINQSDNFTTVFRTLGETDVDFIENEICREFIIKGGHPLFYIGLDKKINFDSLNSLLNKKTLSKYVIKLPGRLTNDIASSDTQTLLSNLTEKESAILNAIEAHMSVGSNNSFKGLRPVAYRSSITSGSLDTGKIIFAPAGEGKNYYPISKDFIDYTESTDSITFKNRPDSNISFEAKNSFDLMENLIQFNLEISSISGMYNLIQAGDTITLLSHPYSAYNGNYIVSKVEYGTEAQSNFMKLQVIRPFLDISWPEKMDKSKNSENFDIGFTPTVHYTEIYNF